jgi:hypothetical protein
MQDIVPLNSVFPSESSNIKIEQTSQDLQSWWSLPSSHSSSTLPISDVPSLSRFGRSNSRAKRAKHPYQIQRHNTGHRLRQQTLTPFEMSAQFGTWSPTTVKNESDFTPEILQSQGQRRSSDGDQQPPYYHFADVNIFYEFNDATR